MSTQDQSILQYFNITMSGSPDPEKIIPAIFQQNRTVPILDNPSEWLVGLVRFYVPALYIPIFKWSSNALPDGTDPDLRIYFTYNGVSVNRAVKYIPQGNDPRPSIERAVWNVSDFIAMVNITIVEAFDAIKTEVGFPTQLPPQLVYNSTTQLISLFADELMDTGSGVGFGMSNLLYSYFPCFAVREEALDYPNSFVYFINIFDNIINNVTYKGVPSYEMLGEYPVLALWNGVNKILFSSASIPIDPEMVGGVTNVLERVIFDFVLSNDQINDRSAISYTNSGGQRYSELLSSFPMKKLDIEILIQFRDLTTAPLRLNSLDSATLKLEFQRR